MTNIKYAKNSAIAFILSFIITMLAGFSVKVYAVGNDHLSNTSIVYTYPQEKTADTDTEAPPQTFSDTDTANTANDASDTEKSINPFFYMFGFLLPVLAVSTFLLFSIITRANRLRMKRAAIKQQVSEESKNN